MKQLVGVDYGTECGPGNWTCKFCQNVYGGALKCLRAHLAHVPGEQVEVCSSVPPNMQAEMLTSFFTKYMHYHPPKRHGHAVFIADTQYVYDGDTLVKLFVKKNDRPYGDLARLADATGYHALDRAATERPASSSARQNAVPILNVGLAAEEASATNSGIILGPLHGGTWSTVRSPIIASRQILTTKLGKKKNLSFLGNQSIQDSSGSKDLKVKEETEVIEDEESDQEIKQSVFMVKLR